jgi:hypothetical protein
MEQKNKGIKKQQIQTELLNTLNNEVEIIVNELLKLLIDSAYNINNILSPEEFGLLHLELCLIATK